MFYSGDEQFVWCYSGYINIHAVYLHIFISTGDLISHAGLIGKCDVNKQMKYIYWCQSTGSPAPPPKK